MIVSVACPVTLLNAQQDSVSPATEESKETESSEQTTLQLSPEYLKLIGESANLFEREEFQQALDRLDKADAIQMETPIALNLRGAIATETGELDSARTLFQKALEKDGAYFPSRFNLGEILFLEKKYTEARDHFMGMLKDTPDNELLQFKVFLTYLMQDDMLQAQQALENIKFPSDTPSYYFANAALHFHQNEPEEARSFIDSSMRIFGAGPNRFFKRSLADLGFLSKEEIVKPAAAESVPSDTGLKTSAGSTGQPVR